MRVNGRRAVLLSCGTQAPGRRDLEETCAYAEEIRPQLCHWFTVDDLHFLKRGGRVSSTAAVVGTMLQIKPVLHVDEEGHLIRCPRYAAGGHL